MNKATSKGGISKKEWNRWQASAHKLKSATSYTKTEGENDH